MRARRHSLYLVPSLAVALALASGTTSNVARRAPKPFPVAELFLELNDTDGDLGLHALIDGEPWTSLEIEAPGERMLLDVISKGPLRSHGMTEIAFESAEPAFDELPPEDTLRRFPEGRYEISAIRQGGGEYESLVRLSHILAAPPVATVNTLPAAESCDATPLPEVAAPVLVNWKAVTKSHPDIGKTGAVTISRYQFFLERGAMKLSVDLPPTVTEFKVPSSLIAARGVYKFEIIARTSTGNNTAIESCFRIP
jgi:hypothetical protein